MPPLKTWLSTRRILGVPPGPPTHRDCFEWAWSHLMPGVKTEKSERVDSWIQIINYKNTERSWIKLTSDSNVAHIVRKNPNKLGFLRRFLWNLHVRIQKDEFDGLPFISSWRIWRLKIFEAATRQVQESTIQSFQPLFPYQIAFVHQPENSWNVTKAECSLTTNL